MIQNKGRFAGPLFCYNKVIMESIIVSLIGAFATVITTVISGKKAGKKADKYDAKNAIIMMILEDHMLVAENKLPVNYQNILHEYDIYHANGGNSYIAEKIEAYKAWFKANEKGAKNVTKRTRNKTMVGK